MLEKDFQKLKFISVSPFNYNCITSGALWRIAFILQFLRSKGSVVGEILRGGQQEPKEGQIYGSKNKFINLLDPKSIFFIAKLLQNSPDAILYCHTLWAGFYGLFFKIFFRKKFYFDNHNVEFDRFRSYRSTFAILIYLIEYVLVKSADRVIMSSSTDAYRLKDLYGVKSIVVENKFDTLGQTFRDKESILNELGLYVKNKNILFFGSLDYKPNQEAVIYIRDNLCHFFQEDLNYKFVIAGMGGEGLLGQQRNNLIYLGFVDKLEELIHSVDLVIAPIFSGGGVKIKVIQSLALGKNIIATQEAVRGISGFNNQIYLADKKTFPYKIIQALGN